MTKRAVHWPAIRGPFFPPITRLWAVALTIFSRGSLVTWKLHQLFLNAKKAEKGCIRLQALFVFGSVFNPIRCSYFILANVCAFLSFALLQANFVLEVAHIMLALIITWRWWLSAVIFAVWWRVHRPTGGSGRTSETRGENQRAGDRDPAASDTGNHGVYALMPVKNP